MSSPTFAEAPALRKASGGGATRRQVVRSIKVFASELPTINMAKECKEKALRKVKPKTLSVKKRKREFSPIESGLIRKEALKEARRCLSLRECESCEVCSLFCPDLCITRDPKTGEVLIDLDYCKGCGICAAVCPKGAIQMVLEEGL